MISVYTSAFNLKICDFDYESALGNFCSFADEVIISTINDNDNSYGLLIKEFIKWNNLKIILTDFQPNFPSFDGSLKNEALQNCSGDILIGMDLDERIPLSDKNNWIRASNFLLNSNHDCLMLPVIDLFKNENYCKSVGVRWRMHKRGFKRGVVNFAKRNDGSHDIELSDSCELITQSGDLVKSLYLINPSDTVEEKLKVIKDQDIPYCFHYGFLDLERRSKINSEFWQNMWNLENGSQVNLDNKEKMNQYKSYEHGLNLE